MALCIRAMTRPEFSTLMQWAAAEGWNPGLHDESIFWSTDPAGMVAAELDGRMVGGGAIVSYGGEYGFMGLFIVDPALRGQGIGAQLWVARRDQLRARLQPGAPMEMDGVFAMQRFYARGGFVLQHRDLRMEAPAWQGGAAAPPRGTELVPLAHVRLEQVCAVDRLCFPADRRSFLEQWVRQPGSTAVGAVQQGQLAGYAVCRPCVRGWKVGPLFALDAATADALLCAATAGACGQPVQLDVPERNTAAVQLATAHGMSQVFGCARMTLGAPPRIAWDRVFGVTTFELG